jgi:uncharacterized protein YukE
VSVEFQNQMHRLEQHVASLQEAMTTIDQRTRRPAESAASELNQAMKLDMLQAEVREQAERIAALEKLVADLRQQGGRRK